MLTDLGRLLMYLFLVPLYLLVLYLETITTYRLQHLMIARHTPFSTVTASYASYTRCLPPSQGCVSYRNVDSKLYNLGMDAMNPNSLTMRSSGDYAACVTSLASDPPLPHGLVELPR